MQIDNKNTLCAVLVNYNDSRYLINWVEKMALQMPDELIIVDDCSTDPSVELIYHLQKKYPQIKLILRHKNGGCFEAFMTGVNNTECTHVSCWSCDDDPLPGYISRMKQAINDYPFVSIFTSNALIKREEYLYERVMMPFDSYISPQHLFKVAKIKGLAGINVIGNVTKREHVIDCWNRCYLKTHFDAWYIFTAAFTTGVVILAENLVLYRANFRGLGSSRTLGDNVKSIKKMNHALVYFPEAQKYLSQLKMWTVRQTIISTCILWLLPHLPKFIRKWMYKKVYSMTL